MVPVKCPACGHRLAAGAARCPSCSVDVQPLPPLLASAGQLKVRNMILESILRGGSPESVRDEHLGKGVPADVVEAALREALKEREAHCWKSGLRDLLIAGPCALLAAVAFATQIAVSDRVILLNRFKMLVAHLFLLAVGLAAGSAFFLVRGLVRLSRGVGSSGKGD